MVDASEQLDQSDSSDQGHNPIQAEPGTLAAKLQWNGVWENAHSPESVAKGKELNPDAVGFYNGKPLVPGAGPGQGDMDLFKDKLMYCNGFSPEVANKIAAKKMLIWAGK